MFFFSKSLFSRNVALKWTSSSTSRIWSARCTATGRSRSPPMDTPSTRLSATKSPSLTWKSPYFSITPKYFIFQQCLPNPHIRVAVQHRHDLRQLERHSFRRRKWRWEFQMNSGQISLPEFSAGDVLYVNLHSENLLHKFRANRTIRALQFSPDDQMLAICRDFDLQIHKLNQMKVHRKLFWSVILFHFHGSDESRIFSAPCTVLCSCTWHTICRRKHWTASTGPSTDGEWIEWRVYGRSCLVIDIVNICIWIWYAHLTSALDLVECFSQAGRISLVHFPLAVLDSHFCILSATDLPKIMYVWPVTAIFEPTCICLPELDLWWALYSIEWSSDWSFWLGYLHCKGIFNVMNRSPSALLMKGKI